MRSLLLLCLAAFLAGCSKTSSMEDLITREVTLPGGQIIKAETAVDTRDVLRALMFRDSLPRDHGMLFVHRVPGQYGYWMYQTNIPLDIIWMDNKHTIVEIVENAPPCKTAASQCPHYGGRETASFVLEVNAGLVKKYGIKTGEIIQW